MSKWILKAITQKAISIMPFSYRINYFFQKNITKAVVLNDSFLKDIIRHFNQAFKEFQSLEKSKSNNGKWLEIGTGWHPIFPLCAFLCGANEFVTVDIRNHVRKENMLDLFKQFKALESKGELRDLLPHLIEERWNTFNSIDPTKSSPEILLGLLNIKTRHGNLSDLNLQNDYFDYCISVNVLQHIPENSIEGLLRQAKILTKNKGLHYYSFGCYDHFCHVDQGISKFNYLQYSKKKWEIIDNSIQPQNRLRVNQFIVKFEKIGFNIARNLSSTPNYKELDKLTKIHSDFKAIHKESLAIDYGTFILIK